ncbi:MAG: tripartite tricarboxylate transporter substrate-binding protein [Candidatus Heteroscillospira sp.]|jgi:tripartite-type tricarboxylate transporter receptor subunit TctC
MSKKIVSLLLALTMILSLVACGGTGESKAPESEAPSPAESKAPESGAPVEDDGKPENYPTKPINLIVPYAAGGAADIVARAVASVLPDYLDGAQINITNVTGGNGVVGVTQLKGSASDGYNISIYASPVFEITPAMNDVGYTMDDFTFLGTVVKRPNVLVVHADSPWQTLEEFVEYVKANPGTVTYGDPAAGSAHLGFEALIKEAGLDMKFVPSSGGTGEAITALLGKHVDAVMALPADTFEYIRSGDMRALCIEADERIDILGDVPTAKECGWDVNVGLTNGFIAPAGLDREIADYLTAALEQAVNDPRVLELDPGDEGLLIYFNGEDTKQLLVDTAESFTGLINDLGLAG